MPLVNLGPGRSRAKANTLAAIAVALFVAALAVLALGRGYAMVKLAATASEPAIVRQTDDWPGPPPRVLVIGDSRVARWRPDQDAGVLRLAISGVGGETSAKLLARWQRSVPPPPGTTVLILTGVNDLVAADLNPDRSAAIEVALVANVAALAKGMEQQGLTPVIGAIGQAGHIDWRRRMLGWSSELYTLIDRSNAKLRALARARGYRWLDTNRALEAGADRRISARFATDTLHWNEAAYRRLEAASAATAGDTKRPPK